MPATPAELVAGLLLVGLVAAVGYGAAWVAARVAGRVPGWKRGALVFLAVWAACAVLWLAGAYSTAPAPPNLAAKMALTWGLPVVLSLAGLFRLAPAPR